MRFDRDVFPIVVAISALVVDVVGAPLKSCNGTNNESGYCKLNYANSLTKVSVDALGEQSGVVLIENRANPPIESDFVSYFTELLREVDFRDKMVFYSGLPHPVDAENFARSRGRYTVEMLLGKKHEWRVFWNLQKDGGYWATWPEALANFWDLASKAFAQQSVGDVWVYFGEAREVEQRHANSTCGAVWCRVEKPILLGSLQSGTVRSIEKFIQQDVGEPKYDPNDKNREGKTALFEAVTAGRADIVTRLLEHGANPNLPGPTHTLWPSAYHPLCLQILLAYGADYEDARYHGAGH
ncbi:cell wall glucanosyltransferase Mwg1 [Purpureocillium lavendulum]|uniref:Cell wall glucanosyltransferase Mwg1 n=1 Tax=Purpureocillium lavendulum TaxID=1247861 RepID=A0AB34FEI4_9HYPO|nr:cell wall glucanosyltransferase Mwg1 [Purpureocillium lavendulum]